MRYKNYTEYTCECGQPAAAQSKSAMRRDGTLAPRVSTLTQKPCCARCLNDGIAIKAGGTTYTRMQNEKTYRGKKYKTPYCENKDGKLGFDCGMKHSYWDGSDESIKNLEVDHIDGNPSNNLDENLMVLCPCCHKTKGRLNGDNKSPGRKTLGITKPGLLGEVA